MLTRFLFWALLIYLAYRIIKALVLGPSRQAPPSQVQGKPKNRPLDLSGQDVEDAKFEEIKENTKDCK
ncbi:hypothetical protein L0337_19055 [candidate division KSB1 bacterium]|nr:hypothetical protein [candidate division KSB1 bacterium]